MIRIIFLLLFSIVIFSNVTHAAMVLDRMVVYFEPNRPWEDITVQNPDKDPLYLKTNVVEVKNPGTSKEKRIEVTDPDNVQLLASPKRVIIPPRGEKLVRLVSLKIPDKNEQVFRVNFTPVSGKITAEHSGVKIMIAYQTLVFVRPKKAFFQIESLPKNNTVTFTNQGNVNVLLRNGKYCPNPKEAKKCVDLSEGTRLYAGENWKLKLPNDAEKSGSIQFGLYDGEKEYTEVFPLKEKKEISIKVSS